MSGPLAGVKVVEFVGLGAAPFCAMMLADAGAEVIRIDRPGGSEMMNTVEPRFDVLARGRRSVAVDLKSPAAAEAVLDLIARADVLLEGFRPGVMERLALGPDVCLRRHPRLVYGRMTGWGQDGPLAQAAGHDINYIALAGVLHAIGNTGAPPAPPMNLVGDFGGGGMLLAFGVLCALHEVRQSGRGQVVDAAMTDGAALLAAQNWGFRAADRWRNERGTNVNDGGAHYYNAYACADGRYVSIAAAEPKFYALLREKLGLDDPAFDAQDDPARWPDLKEMLARIFRTRTSAEWRAVLEGTDVCFAPVLDWNEAPEHPHTRARGMFIDIAGVTQPAPAPRFSRTPPTLPTAPSASGADTEAVLRDWGFSAERVRDLQAAGAIAGKPSA